MINLTFLVKALKKEGCTSSITSEQIIQFHQTSIHW